MEGVQQAPWYADWQHQEHAKHFDQRSRLSDRGLVRNLESFNDVRLLCDHLREPLAGELLEVGCATGEMYRYLKLTQPAIAYTGLDISESAIERARSKYADANFVLGDPVQSISDNLKSHSLATKYAVVYSKDVLHHQTQPWDFLDDLMASAQLSLFLRTRTRDEGETVLDPNQSCQYHYNGWMPYVVFNLDELVRQIQQRSPSAEVVVLRNHMVLGGRENRFLPKECYLPQTGTAESAVGICFSSEQPGRVLIEDREDRVFPSTWQGKLKQLIVRA